MRLHGFGVLFVGCLATGLASSCLADDGASANASSARPARGAHAGSAFIASWDSNGDGEVSREEYDAARKQRFALTDKDGNAELSVEEYAGEYAVRLDEQLAEARSAAIEQTHRRFRSLDANSDGRVARAEYDKSGERMFTRLDADGDGRISATDPGKAPDARGESRQARPARMRSVLAMPTSHTRAGFLELYDDDGDDRMTRAEFDRQRAATFANTDANHDGTLDRAEYLAEFSGRLDLRSADTRQAQLKQAHTRFKSIDADESGAVSRAEYFDMSTRYFERADTNHDDKVTREDPPPPPASEK